MLRCISSRERSQFDIVEGVVEGVVLMHLSRQPWCYASLGTLSASSACFIPSFLPFSSPLSSFSILPLLYPRFVRLLFCVFLESISSPSRYPSFFVLILGLSTLFISPLLLVYPLFLYLIFLSTIFFIFFLFVIFREIFLWHIWFLRSLFPVFSYRLPVSLFSSLSSRVRIAPFSPFPGV